jgi:hypothetical protein
MVEQEWVMRSVGAAQQLCVDEYICPEQSTKLTNESSFVKADGAL